MYTVVTAQTGLAGAAASTACRDLLADAEAPRSEWRDARTRGCDEVRGTPSDMIERVRARVCAHARAEQRRTARSLVRVWSLDGEKEFIIDRL